MSNAETISTVITVTDDTFEGLVLYPSISKAVLVDFWAQWCPPCHMLSPVLDEIAAELGDRLIVAKVNVDENQATAQRYGILALPTLSVFRNGEIISQVVGALPKRRLFADLSSLLGLCRGSDARLRLRTGGRADDFRAAHSSHLAGRRDAYGNREVSRRYRDRLRACR